MHSGRRWRTGAVALLALAASACGGAGSPDPLTLASIGPTTGVPVTLDTTLQLTGRRLNEYPTLILRVVGVRDLPCTPLSDTRATCFVPAGSLPVGTHEVMLVNEARFTNPRPLLVVNAPPTLSSLSLSSFDANFNLPFTLTGTGFIEPIQVRFLDTAGDPMSLPLPCTMTAPGTEIQAESPVMPGVAGPISGSIQIENGDGQAATAGMPIVVDCMECDVRTIEGTGNNLSATAMGSAGIRLRREVPADYADGISSPPGGTRPSTRAVSNAVCKQTSTPPNSVNASAMFWVWGQFVDHDIDLTPSADPAEPFDIPVPTGDPEFDPGSTGTAEIGLDRSVYDPASGTSAANPREQLNQITSWMDASNVYGSDAARAAFLRVNDGSGRLKTSPGNLLTFNTGGFDNAMPDGFDPTTFFLAGDVRCNEQVGLTAMHTVWMREHNRWADEIAAKNPGLTGDEIYQAARRWVAAEMQVITFKEFLPLLLGPGAVSTYPGYEASTVADVGNVFSTALYRFGHSLVGTTLQRLDASLNPIPEGHLALRDGFFRPDRLVNEGGVEPLLRGFVVQESQELDPRVVEDLRSFLFGPPGAGGFDLPALNMQRGRDHGLPSYVATRAALGLSVPTTFAQVTSDATVQADLASVYATVADIDLWIGALAEDKVAGALVGELLFTVIKDQFERLRNADRFWYERVFTGDALARVEATTLAGVIRANTSIGNEIPDDVFVVPGP